MGVPARSVAASLLVQCEVYHYGCNGRAPLIAATAFAGDVTCTITDLQGNPNCVTNSCLKSPPLAESPKTCFHTYMQAGRNRKSTAQSNLKSPHGPFLSLRTFLEMTKDKRQTP